jgi:hypothetical protein
MPPGDPVPADEMKAFAAARDAALAALPAPAVLQAGDDAAP